MRKVVSDPNRSLTMGKMMIWAIICRKPWNDRMSPMVFADNPKPPSNLKGQTGGTSELAEANMMGRSCSSAIV